MDDGSQNCYVDMDSPHDDSSEGSGRLVYSGQPIENIPRNVTSVVICPSVKDIAAEAFRGCERLEQVAMHNGVEGIGKNAFYGCASLKHVKMPSVKKIHEGAFEKCADLAEVEVGEGLELIDYGAFRSCTSLKRFKVPSTVKGIAAEAFCCCTQLEQLELCEGLEWIEYLAFLRCRSLKSVKIPSSCKNIGRGDGGTFNSCSQLEVVELGAGIDQFGTGTFGCCESLKSIKVPPPITGEKWRYPPMFYAIWGDAQPETIDILLRSHKFFYPHSILDWDAMIEAICRTEQPGAPLDTVLLLLRVQQVVFPDQSIDWQKASRELTIRFLIERSNYGFHDDDGGGVLSPYYWKREFFREWGTMIEALRRGGVRESSVDRELIHHLVEIQQQFFAEDPYDARFLQQLCEKLVEPLTGWWRPDNETNDLNGDMRSFWFLVHSSVTERWSAIKVPTWSSDIKCLVEMISSTEGTKLDDLFDIIRTKLDKYEREYPQLKDASALLELALWKAKINASMETSIQLGVGSSVRKQCRISCGSGVIIPNVLAFLVAVEHDEEDSAGDAEDMSTEAEDTSSEEEE